MSKKELNENIIIISMMCINIFLSLPLLLYKIYKNKKINIYLWGIYFFIFGFFFISSNENVDINRYYTIINNLKAGIIVEELPIILHRDLYVPFLLFFIVKLNLPNMFVGGVSAFITYIFLFKSFNLVTENIKLSKKQFFIYFVILIINIPILGFVGVRFSSATSIFVYGVVGYYQKMQKKYLVWIFISPLIHFGMWLMVVLFIISLLIPGKFIKKINIYGFIIFIISNFNLEKLILIVIDNLNKIKPLFNSKGYILHPQYGSKYGLHLNILGIIGSRILVIIPIVIFLLTLLYIKKYKKYPFIYLGILLLFLLQNNGGPFNRYSLGLLFIIYLVNISNKIFMKNFNKYNCIYFIYFLCGIIRLIRDLRSYYSLLYECYIMNIFEISLTNFIIKNITEI